jgi:hypothetical protein
MNIKSYIVLVFVLHPTHAISATIYLDESAYINALSTGGYGVIQEGFEDDVVWADSRTSPVPSVISQGIIWTSNHSMNGVRTGTLGGSVIDGTYGFFSLPHGDDTDSGPYCDDAPEPIPTECWLNDGWMITAPTGKTLYGAGGWFDSNTGGGAKVTFLLDGVDVNGNDSDNIDNWQRDGDRISGWTFVGVIDTNGFSSAEILELSGKDYQQEFIFGDKFSIGMTADATLPGDFNADGLLDCEDVNALTAAVATDGDIPTFDLNGDGMLSLADVDVWRAEAGETNLGPGKVYLPGDATLDGVVDGQDFLEWNAHKFTGELGWCSGNLNADNVVDGQDFLIWNDYKFQASDALSAVPEPGAGILAILAVAMLGATSMRRLGQVRRALASCTHAP